MPNTQLKFLRGINQRSLVLLVSVLALISARALMPTINTDSAAFQQLKSLPVLSVVAGPTLTASTKWGPEKADAYLNVANCRDALEGGNGDNDLLDWMYAHAYTNYQQAADYTRYDDHRVRVGVNWYDWRGGTLNRRYYGHGYCLGDNSNIVDRANESPTGW